MIDILKDIANEVGDPKPITAKAAEPVAEPVIATHLIGATLRPLCPVCYEFECDCVKRQLKPEEVVFGKEPGKASATSGSGRGPSGKLRNFKAMNDYKLDVTIRDITNEHFDREAWEKCSAECRSRGRSFPSW